MSTEVVAVTGIAAGGDGVGRLADGRAVFVPRTAPGERVRLREGTLRLHRHFARGDAAEIIEAAGDRVVPLCPHYVGDRCGGCQIQHLAYAAQLAAKRAIVGEALRRIGKLDVPDPDIEPAPDPWHYRTKIAMAIARGRGGETGSAAVTIGLHPYDRPDRVFALRECHIVDPRLMALWRALTSHLDLLPPRASRLTLRLDRDGRHHVVVESRGTVWQNAAALREALRAWDVVCWWQPTDGAARVIAGPETGFPATAFEQVNAVMGMAARRWAVDRLGEIGGALVWDLYGGIGDTALLLAARGASVVSVDADEKAVSWARRRPDVAGYGDRLRFIAARAEDVLPSLAEPQAVVVNPPRAGLHWDVALRLTGQPVPRLVYVSCDPATLARDLHRLAVNYQLRAVRAFDLFPQTAHVETVVYLEGA